MIDIFLILLIIAQWVIFVWWENKRQEKENKLINALVAKNPEQMVNLTVADKIKPEPEPTPDPDLVPESQLSDEEFDKLIVKGGLNG